MSQDKIHGIKGDISFIKHGSEVQHDSGGFLYRNNLIIYVEYQMTSLGSKFFDIVDLVQFQIFQQDGIFRNIRCIGILESLLWIDLQSAKHDPTNQSLNNDISTQRYALWIDTMDAIWPALEQKLDPDAMQDLLASQLEWSVWQIQELKNTEAEAKDGFVSAALHYGTGADMLEQRGYFLLNILEGNTSILPRDPSTELSAEKTISQFMRAYYSGDRDAVKQYLSASYNLDVDVYTDYEPADPEISTIKGLDNLVHDMADWGTIRPSIQFRITPDSDYYVYLSMTLTWEDAQWKVSEYGLEG